ncbi:YheC/YheD family protein [Virgibacillus oceani]
MIIGYMRNQKKPTFSAKLTAKLCKYHGIDLIYIRPKDVDIEKGKVKGKLLVNNEWISVQKEIPPFIDIFPSCFKEKNKKITDYLAEKTFLSDNRTNRLPKNKLQKKLENDSEFSHLVIPTERARKYKDIKEFSRNFSEIVLKPLKGGRGKGIYILYKDKNSYILGYQKEEKRLSKKGLKIFFENHLKNKGYIMQKHVQSRTSQGDPFDCRIHLEKNGEGKWQVAKIFIRIGIGQKVISNVNQGGGISEVEPFLQANFENKHEEIIHKLKLLADTLPYKIEQLRATHIMSLGLDVGIDKNGHLYLFESNGSPTTKTLEAEVAMLRSEYYTYVLDNLI